MDRNGSMMNTKKLITSSIRSIFYSLNNSVMGNVNLQNDKMDKLTA